MYVPWFARQPSRSAWSSCCASDARQGRLLRQLPDPQVDMTIGKLVSKTLRQILNLLAALPKLLTQAVGLAAGCRAALR